MIIAGIIAATLINNSIKQSRTETWNKAREAAASRIKSLDFDCSQYPYHLVDGDSSFVVECFKESGDILIGTSAQFGSYLEVAHGGNWKTRAYSSSMGGLILYIALTNGEVSCPLKKQTILDIIDDEWRNNAYNNPNQPIIPGCETHYDNGAKQKLNNYQWDEGREFLLRFQETYGKENFRDIL